MPPTPAPSAVPTPSSDCPDTCFGQNCDYWDSVFGVKDRVCDVNGDALEAEFSCNCGGCTCQNCSNTYTIHMESSDPDCNGWGNAALSIADCDGNLLAGFITLFDGTEAKTSECLDPAQDGYQITVTEGLFPETVRGGGGNSSA